MSGKMKTKLFSPMCARVRGCARAFVKDRRGVAAIEFAMIVPIMLVLFFGTVEFSSGIAVDRKVTLVARTLSDLTSQSLSSISDNDLKNFFAASSSILTPYSGAPTQPVISEIYIDNNKIAKIQWSKSATLTMVNGSPQATLQTSPRSKGDAVTVPAGLLVPNTYLIWSEVSYDYVPTVGYVLKSSITLREQNYSRPRQSPCVDYPAPVPPNTACTPVS
jgi:Flp pilus assembly protein TadG